MVSLLLKTTDSVFGFGESDISLGTVVMAVRKNTVKIAAIILFI